VSRQRCEGCRWFLRYTTKAAAIKTAERLLVDILEQNRVGNRIEIRDVTGEEPAL
jgi:LSD1 subclass zinc finger protein